MSTMPALDANTLLQLAPNVEVRFRSPVDTEIRVKGVAAYRGASALSILDVFSRPVTFSEGLKRLRTRIAGMADWIECTSTIQVFHAAGILIGDEGAETSLTPSSWGFDAAHVHISMLDDRARTSSYLAAIAEVVRPGDVVLDIGTGTGVLAIAAARAGARHVYAVEVGNVGRLAQANFEANGLADRITLIQGRSTEITLPEAADVLVAELIGKDPLGERVLEVTADATKRLLKPGARLVPGKLEIFGLPVTIPDATLSEYVFTPGSVRRWREWYDIDFHALAEPSRRARSTAIYCMPQKVRDWEALAPPVPLAKVDFSTNQEWMIENTQHAVADRSGSVNGMATFFDLELGPNTRFSTRPAEVDDANHWATQVWSFSEPLQVEPGDGLEVSYRYRVPGKQNGVEVSRS